MGTPIIGGRGLPKLSRLSWGSLAIVVLGFETPIVIGYRGTPGLLSYRRWCCLRLDAVQDRGAAYTCARSRLTWFRNHDDLGAPLPGSANIRLHNK